jgi:endoglucanase
VRLLYCFGMSGHHYFRWEARRSLLFAGSGRSWRSAVRVLASVVSALAIVGAGASPAQSQASQVPGVTSPKVPPVVAVSGNHLVDKSGAALQLRGVNRSGLEYACIQGWGFFDGPNVLSDNASIPAMASWATNVVRLPLNEDCWLGINGNSTNAPYVGQAYRSTVLRYVRRLHAYGLAVILDLQFAEPGTTPAQPPTLEPMPDADHAPAFWKSVARNFKGDKSAVFDLYNEPHDVSWSCWRNGCQVTSSATGAPYTAVGMQSLLTTVRSTGATNTVIVGGLGYSGDITGWLANAPTDSAGQLAVSMHLYNFGSCVTVACWDAQDAPVAASVPVITGELGENDCATGFVNTYMPWADTHNISYLAWTWDTWGCGGIALISSYNGTPTTYGQGIYDHFLSRANP